MNQFVMLPREKLLKTLTSWCCWGFAVQRRMDIDLYSFSRQNIRGFLKLKQQSHVSYDRHNRYNILHVKKLINSQLFNLTFSVFELSFGPSLKNTVKNSILTCTCCIHVCSKLFTLPISYNTCPAVAKFLSAFIIVENIVKLEKEADLFYSHCPGFLLLYFLYSKWILVGTFACQLENYS